MEPSAGVAVPDTFVMVGPGPPTAELEKQVFRERVVSLQPREGKLEARGGVLVSEEPMDKLVNALDAEHSERERRIKLRENFVRYQEQELEKKKKLVEERVGRIEAWEVLLERREKVLCEEVLSLQARERNLEARERRVQGEVEAAGLGRVGGQS